MRFCDRCPICSTRVIAATHLVLDQRMVAHVLRCKARAIAKRKAAAAARAQGSLFGGK